MESKHDTVHPRGKIATTITTKIAATTLLINSASRDEKLPDTWNVRTQLPTYTLEVMNLQLVYYLLV